MNQMSSFAVAKLMHSNVKGDRHRRTQQSVARHLTIVGMIIFGLTFVGGIQPASAQGKKSAAKKNAPIAARTIAVPENELTSYGFNSEAEIIDHSVTDPDETPDGQTQLAEVTRRAKEIYVEFKQIQKDRAPPAGQRDVLAGQINQCLVTIAQCENQIENNVQQRNQLQFAILSDGQKKAQADNFSAAIAQFTQQKQFAQNEIDKRTPPFDALNIQIRPFDERLRKLTEELNACRKQWLDIRVPQEKYARGEFENLKRVIDDWSRVDGLWPQAFCWGALCANELGQFEAAWELVETAEKLRIEVLNSRRPWPQIAALRGLIAVNIPKLRSKSDGWISDALKGVDRKSDWETLYIVGRAMVQKPGQSKRAEAFLNQTLQIKPSCLSAQYQLALVQTTANSGAPNLTEGTKQLEELWTKTGKRSWRIGYALATAYKAAERNDDVEMLSEKVLELAPSIEKTRLRKEFAKKL